MTGDESGLSVRDGEAGDGSHRLCTRAAPREYDKCPYFDGEGWWPILDDCVPKMTALGGQVERAYEKYGTLRIDVVPYSSEMETLADEAEQRSEVTCECCGEPGVARVSRHGWAKTLCGGCFDAWDV